MIKDQLAAQLAAALEKAKASGDLPLDAIPTPTLEMPKSKAHGDWATSVALALAGPLQLAPREVAARIVRHLTLGELIADAQIAGPGFINLTLQPDWLGAILRRIETEGERYGQSDDGGGRKIVVEFVSANPNGPITVAAGRNAALGDAISSLLILTGWDVSREYYVNDPPQSTQMNNFGRSVFARYRQLLGHADFDPEQLEYGGEYVMDVARAVIETHGNEYEHLDAADPQTVHLFRDLSEGGMTAQHKSDLESFGVHYDSWFSESALHANGQVQSALDALTDSGHTYEKDGAVWLKTLEGGLDVRDNVLIRQSGAPTYLMGDIAYHKDKFDRGFDRALNVWGADHAGAVDRLKAAMGMLGYDSSRLDVLLYQLVRIMKSGEFVKSSKRRGDVLELKADLIDEIGSDAARFYFLLRSPHTVLDIDIDLAKKTEKDNPVYYVQYAHARIVQTIEKALTEKGVAVPAASDADLSLLTEDAETDLIKKLGEFPGEVRQAAQDLAPQRITQYARDLAALFHTFYDAGNRSPALRVVCDDPALMRARLVLVSAARAVLKNALVLLGVSAPERM